jgi:peptidoglycan/LPS O-acetylase OafA/YrhL
VFGSIQHTKSHNLPLDSIRGIAAVSVVVHHFVISQTLMSSLPSKAIIDIPFFHNAWIFVDLFFVLSGIVISLNYAETNFKLFSFREFMVRRFARIYPLHFVMLMATLAFKIVKLTLLAGRIVSTVPAEVEVNNLYSFILNLFLLHALGFVDYLSWNGPSWSISAEFYTYITFGVVLTVVGILRDIRWLYIIAGFIIFCSVLTILIVLERRSLDFTNDFGFVRCLSSFFLGVLTVRIVWMIPAELSPAVQNLIQIASAVIAVGLISNLDEVPELSFIAPIFFAVLLGSLMAFGRCWLPRLLSSKPLVWLGKRSYSIYMVHSFVLVIMEYSTRFIGPQRLQVVDHFLIGQTASLMLMLFVSAVLAISAITFNYVEVPGGRAVIKFFNRAPSFGRETIRDKAQHP